MRLLYRLKKSQKDKNILFARHHLTCMSIRPLGFQHLTTQAVTSGPEILTKPPNPPHRSPLPQILSHPIWLPSGSRPAQSAISIPAYSIQQLVAVDVFAVSNLTSTSGRVVFPTIIHYRHETEAEQRDLLPDRTEGVASHIHSSPKVHLDPAQISDLPGNWRAQTLNTHSSPPTNSDSACAPLFWQPPPRNLTTSSPIQQFLVLSRLVNQHTSLHGQVTSTTHCSANRYSYLRGTVPLIEYIHARDYQRTVSPVRPALYAHR